VKLSTHFHLKPSLTMCGAIPQPPRTFMSWCSIKHKDKQRGEECPRNENPNPKSHALVLASSLQFLLNYSYLWHSKNSLIINRLIHSWKFNNLTAKTMHLRWVKFRNRSSTLKLLHSVPQVLNWSFEAQRSLYVVAGFTFRNFKVFQQNTFMYFVWIS
jgi:hypothetical protein